MCRDEDGEGESEEEEEEDDDEEENDAQPGIRMECCSAGDGEGGQSRALFAASTPSDGYSLLSCCSSADIERIIEMELSNLQECEQKAEEYFLKKVDEGEAVFMRKHVLPRIAEAEAQLAAMTMCTPVRRDSSRSARGSRPAAAQSQTQHWVAPSAARSA